MIDRVMRVICVILPNVVPTDRIVTEISRFFGIQDGDRPPSWILKSSNDQRSLGRRWLKCVSMPNFATIGQSVVEIWRFFVFPRWRQSTILDLLCGGLDHPQRWSYHCAKFGWKNMHVVVSSFPCTTLQSLADIHCSSDVQLRCQYRRTQDLDAK